MSLVAYAVRTCLWRALYDRTAAGTLVHDSAVTEFDKLTSGFRPFIVVSTDDDEGDVSGHDYAAAARRLEVVIEIAVGSVENVGTEAEPNYAISLVSSDEGLEATVDFIGRQVMRVLQSGDDVFSDLFRAFTPGDKKLMRRRGAGTNPRFAARQITITCGTVAEPEFGRPPEGEWARLVTAMAADAHLSGQSGLLASEIAGEAIPDWERLRAALGATRAGLKAAGLGPQIPGEAPAPFSEATIAMEHAAVVVAEGDAP